MVLIDFWKDEDMFVAKVRNFPVASQGMTIEEALDNVEEALQLYLEDPDVQAQLRVAKKVEVEVEVKLASRFEAPSTSTGYPYARETPSSDGQGTSDSAL